jgi:hypothetical protein
VAATTRTYNPNSGSSVSAASINAWTSATVGGCCSRCGWDGADANVATLRDTSPHRSAWRNAARITAWIWRTVAGAKPRRSSEPYSPSR